MKFALKVINITNVQQTIFIYYFNNAITNINISVHNLSEKGLKNG